MDGGGPKREFWRLLACDVRQSMCMGHADNYVLRHDVIGLQVFSCRHNSVLCIWLSHACSFRVCA